MNAQLLTALQLADSGFPSGGFAYSWGLETAAGEGLVDRAGFSDWLSAELLDRWAQFDRVVLSDAFRADDALAVDGETDRLFWAEALRACSADAGQAFLAAVGRLGDPVAVHLRDAALKGETPGHLPVAQGAVFRSMGLSLELGLAVSAHTAAQGLASAGVRLGLVGALEAQRSLTALHADLAAVLTPPTPGTRPAAFSPISEIAMLRPADGRLFAN